MGNNLRSRLTPYLFDRVAPNFCGSLFLRIGNFFSVQMELITFFYFFYFFYLSTCNRSTDKTTCKCETGWLMNVTLLEWIDNNYGITWACCIIHRVSFKPVFFFVFRTSSFIRSFSSCKTFQLAATINTCRVPRTAITLFYFWTFCL